MSYYYYLFIFNRNMDYRSAVIFSSVFMSFILFALSFIYLMNLISISQMDYKINSINKKNVKNYNKGKNYIEEFKKNNVITKNTTKIKKFTRIQEVILLNFFTSNLRFDDFKNSKYIEPLKKLYPNINSTNDIKKIKDINFLYFLYTMLKNKENDENDENELEKFPIKSEWREYKKTNKIYKNKLKLSITLFVVFFILFILSIIYCVIIIKSDRKGIKRIRGRRRRQMLI